MAATEPVRATQLRHALVDFLRQQGVVRSAPVEKALRTVPRHLFSPQVDLQTAYENRVIPLKTEAEVLVSSISQPTMVALMLEQLDVQPGQRVLEIGAGSGYNAALLAELVGPTGQVTTLDIDEDLVQGAIQHLQAANYPQVHAITHDGSLGYPPHAPYDRILLTVGSEDLAPAWFAQLVPGGRCVLPLAIHPHTRQKSIAFQAVGLSWHSRSVIDCAFTPLRGAMPTRGIDWQPLPDRPDIQLETRGELPLSLTDLARLLSTRPTRDIPTQLRLTPAEISHGLSLWLAMHTPHTRLMLAHHRARRLLPDLLSGIIYHGTDMPIHVGLGLMQPDGLAALIALPPRGRAKPYEQRPLAIRQWGQATAAEQLADLVTSWQEAGQPGTSNLQIMAHLQQHPPSEPPSGFAVDTPNARLWLQFRS